MKSFHTTYQSRDFIKELDRNNSQLNILLHTHSDSLLYTHELPLLMDIKIFLHQHITRIELFRSTIQLMIANIDIVKWFQHYYLKSYMLIDDNIRNNGETVMSKKKYKWIIPEELPRPARPKKRVEYDEAIDEFLNSDLKSARVNIPNVKPKTLYATLQTRIRMRKLRDKIRVIKRKDKVFLYRIE